MKTYKPDLNEKVTIRVSVATKAALRDLCARNDLDESLITRMALEAGMALAKEHGITQLMEAREKTLKSVVTVPSAKKEPVKKVAPYVLVKGAGASWDLIDPTGKTLKKGPLYVIRPYAKKVCPPGSRIELQRPDGSVELLA